ncbi:MAG: benzoyl-CoA reductase subunit A [Acidobacteria bacterium]|nr:MAG: benzoyl-CoA reductase subunit A [Acidobacteriota bacterium]
MKCVVGIDLGSTTTKAVLLDPEGGVLGRGITNSRSNYEVAAAVAREEALTSARFALLERAVAGDGGAVQELFAELERAFRLEIYLDHLAALRQEIEALVAAPWMSADRAALEPAAAEVLAQVEERAPSLFAAGAERRSDFFRDLAGAAYMAAAEAVAARRGAPYDRLLALYDRAILEVETRLLHHTFEELVERAIDRLRAAGGDRRPAALRRRLAPVLAEPIEELAFAGTGYGRQTLPFPKEAIRSEILCHGRGAHRIFPGTRTVLDIGGQDTKAIQVDAGGVVTAFQMNDRCAAGCGRYLGYIADELNLGLHELGPLALKARKTVRVSSTCTVFAGAELRERLALGQAREDILAGLHRAIMLRAMSLLARSGGIDNELTFTGGVCKNPMATRILKELVAESYGDGITINVHPDSIYMGALGAALFARDDLRAGRPRRLPTFAAAA